jgi:hypothetical protein
VDLSEEDRVLVKDLTRYDLVRSDGFWDLRAGGKVVASFSTKSDAVNGRKMKRMIGCQGGTLYVHTDVGSVEEERTYPSWRGSTKSSEATS